jgi:hypothetical protein
MAVTPNTATIIPDHAQQRLLADQDFRNGDQAERRQGSVYRVRRSCPRPLTGPTIRSPASVRCIQLDPLEQRSPIQWLRL